MKIIVDWQLCDGNGNCAAAAPTLFKLDEQDALQVLKDTVVGENETKQADAAVRVCPKGALKLAD